MEYTTNVNDTRVMSTTGKRGIYTIAEKTLHARIWWEVTAWVYGEPDTLAIFPTCDAATEYVEWFDSTCPE